MENTLRHQHPPTRLGARFGLLDGLSLDGFDFRAAEERANVNLLLCRSGGAANFGFLQRAVVRLASGQWRGRQEKAARQHTNGVTVAHMFSGCEIELSESESRTACSTHCAGSPSSARHVDCSLDRR